MAKQKKRVKGSPSTVAEQSLGYFPPVKTAKRSKNILSSGSVIDGNVFGIKKQGKVILFATTGTLINED